MDGLMDDWCMQCLEPVCSYKGRRKKINFTDMSVNGVGGSPAVCGLVREKYIFPLNLSRNQHHLCSVYMVDHLYTAPSPIY